MLATIVFKSYGTPWFWNISEHMLKITNSNTTPLLPHLIFCFFIDILYSTLAGGSEGVGVSENDMYFGHLSSHLKLIVGLCIKFLNQKRSVCAL